MIFDMYEVQSESVQEEEKFHLVGVLIIDLGNDEPAATYLETRTSHVYSGSLW